MKGDRERVQGEAFVSDAMAGDKRSGGGDGALTDLARRGRGDKVGRDLKPSRRRHHRHGSAVAAGPTYPLFINTEAALKWIRWIGWIGWIG